MSCLYCGKEIGPIQLLRGDDFCSPAHRKSYGSRLGKALQQACQPEPVPVRLADFAQRVRPAPGNPAQAGTFRLIAKTTAHGMELPAAWRIGVPAVLGRNPRPLKPARPAERESLPPSAICLPLGLAGGEKPSSALGFLRFTLEVSREEAPAAPIPAPPVAAPRPIPSAQPAARLVRPYALEARTAAHPLSLPAFGLQLVEHAPALAHRFGFLRTPVPEPAMREVRQAASLAPARQTSRSDSARLPGLTALRPVFERARVQPKVAAPSREDPGSAPASQLAAPLRDASGAPSIALAPVSWRPRRNPALQRQQWLENAEGTAPRALPLAGFAPSLDLPAQLPGVYTPLPAQPLRAETRSALPPAMQIGIAPDARWAPRPPARLPVTPADRAARPITPDVFYASEIPGQLPAWEDPFQARPAMPVPGFQLRGGFLARKDAAPVLAPPQNEARRRPVSLPALAVSPLFETQALPDDEDLTGEAPPEAGFVPLDYHCHGVRGPRVPVLEWLAPRRPLQVPEWLPEPSLSRLEDLAPKKTKNRRPATVVVMPGTIQHPSRTARAMRAVSALAAGLFVGVGIWAGASAVRLGNRAPVVHQEAAPVLAEVDSTAVSGAADWTPGRSASADAPQKQSKGPFGWLRESVARRASVHVTDTFATGMEAWGSPAKGWAPGWLRHSDGYVRPGQLALLRPSLSFQDYRLEFFAQIEKKSMGWVIRARDRQNYIAMKFTVVEPGLRPVIAAVHYPVVNGRRGRRVETPL
ncbi:MAG: hypothetical protein LAQ30_24790, partial [Acidobacteriia bacterium]|nr:hypothetical protein [Terriglobia bacterium]